MIKHEVFLSILAERKLDLLLDFLAKEWGQNSKQKYLEKFKRAIDQISAHPRSCQESSEMKGIYKCMVTKQSSFYYRIQNDEIEIITVFDNRQDQKTVFEAMRGETERLRDEGTKGRRDLSDLSDLRDER